MGSGARIDLVLAGNAVTARILAGYIARDDRYRILGCVVDDAYVDKSDVPGFRSVGISEVEQVFAPRDARILMATGYADVNGTRKSLFDRLGALGYEFETYIHPGAMVCCEAPPGAGSVIMPGALLEPGCKVGRDCFVWGNAVIAHDAEIGDHCWIAAGAVVSGMAKTGERCFVGVNATIANKVEVGAGCILGGAAFISRNVKPDTVLLARSAEPFRATAAQYAHYFGI